MDSKFQADTADKKDDEVRWLKILQQYVKLHLAEDVKYFDVCVKAM